MTSLRISVFLAFFSLALPSYGGETGDRILNSLTGGSEEGSAVIDMSLAIGDTAVVAGAGIGAMAHAGRARNLQRFLPEPGEALGEPEALVRTVQKGEATVIDFRTGQRLTPTQLQALAAEQAKLKAKPQLRAKGLGLEEEVCEEVRKIALPQKQLQKTGKSLAGKVEGQIAKARAVRNLCGAVSLYAALDLMSRTTLLMRDVTPGVLALPNLAIVELSEKHVPAIPVAPLIGPPEAPISAPQSSILADLPKTERRHGHFY